MFAGVFQRKYGVLTAGKTNIRITIDKFGTTGQAIGSDYTPGAGDVKTSKDGGAAVNITNLPTAVAMGNGAYWEFVLTAAELTCGQLVVTISTASVKPVVDTAFVVETFGNASAMYAADRSASVPAVAGDAMTLTGAYDAAKTAAAPGAAMTLTSPYDAAKSAAAPGAAMTLTSDYDAAKGAAAALDAAARNAIADAILDRADAIYPGVTPRRAIQLGMVP